jgi:FkbM family methyltransferase
MLSGRHIRHVARSRISQERTRWRIRTISLRGGIVVEEDELGTRFLVYPEDRSSAHFWRTHPDGPDVLASMRYLIPPGGIALDVGAHFGLYAAEMSRRVGTSGQVHAFEPVPYTYWRLRETIALNRLGNVTPQQCAISCEVGAAKINVFPTGYEGWNTMLPNPRGHSGVEPEQALEVPVETLDHYCAAHDVDRVEFLKVDVEGLERDVLLGASDLLSGHRIRSVCFEVSAATLADVGITSSDVFSVLADAGYRVYRFLDHERRFLGPLSEADAEWGNYWCSGQFVGESHLGRGMTVRLQQR